ncbi:MAG: UDP-3-O-acyl-N-acetylglucosamine deacetylase [Myxococcota bacterium]
MKGARPIRFDGIGLHSGRWVSARVRPTWPGHGIVFVVSTDDGPRRIPARLRHVQTDRDRRTVLAANGTFVQTPEHLLAALTGSAIWDAVIQVEGNEIPALDGSAEPFVHRLREHGWRATEPRPAWFVRHPVEVREVLPTEPIRMARLEPLPYEPGRADPQLILDLVIRYPPPLPSRQSWSGPIEATTFQETLAGARTYGDARHGPALRARGLALGASPDNTVVFDASGPWVPLRWPDEPVRHKALDVLGDLALLGGPVHGILRSWGPGHRLTHALLERAVRCGALVRERRRAEPPKVGTTLEELR